MLTLKAISPSAFHGYGILLQSQQMSKELWKASRDLHVPHSTGSNFAAGLQANGKSRSAGFHRLTAAGKRPLQSPSEGWKRLTGPGRNFAATPEEL